MLMIILLLVILGFCFGSFVNAVVWRLHEQSKPKRKRAATDKELSIVRGRSMCVHCKHPLAPADLIPLFSWLWLRGKCRYCHKPIDDQPLTEAVLPVLFVISYIWWPVGFDRLGLIDFIVWLVVLVGMAALALYDFRWMILPSKIIYPLVALGTVDVIAHILLSSGGLHYALSVAQTLLITSGIFYALHHFSRGRWVGDGDYRLGFVIGLILADPAKGFLMIFVASLLGTIVSLPLVALHRLTSKAHVPFGPFLIAATIIVQLFGTSLLDWYGRTFLGM